MLVERSRWPGYGVSGESEFGGSASRFWEEGGKANIDGRTSAVGRDTLE